MAGPSRLDAEWQRLYGAKAGDTGVRALVLELAQPAEWAPLARLWQAVQTELGLPAPAIAVSGVDGLQLWFSLQQPVPAAQAQAFLAALRDRYLPDLAPRIRLWPAVAAAEAPECAARVPAPQPGSGLWSAFVAPDLAALFADTPWLDLPPSDDGQAALLAGLASITPDAWAAAWARLGPPAAEAAAMPAPAAAGLSADGPAATAAATHLQDPQAFLLGVMNDPAVPLSLRIEAAKALLPPRGP